jgi:hypothetical protein
VERNEAPRRPDTEQLTLAVEGTPDSDPEELAQLTSQLRNQLLQLDVESVELVRRGEAPPGSKVVDPITIGTLVVTLAPSVIQAVIAFVQNWHKNRPVSSVKIALGDDSLELTDVSAERVEQLTRAFMARHPLIVEDR